MTEAQILKELARSHWRSLERLLKRAFRAGVQTGVARARGQGRRGRTIRDDATVEGLVSRIEEHFGLARYGFEVRIVHAHSGRRVPAHHQLRRYRVET